MARVSVVIPAYNYGRFVGAAIESVLGQTFADFELVVVDDGSTDDTGDVVARYSDSRLRYIRKENAGLPAARNTGIRAGTADLVAFLDADDTWLPGKLAAQAPLFAADPGLVLVW